MTHSSWTDHVSWHNQNLTVCSYNYGQSSAWVTGICSVQLITDCAAEWRGCTETVCNQLAATNTSMFLCVFILLHLSTCFRGTAQSTLRGIGWGEEKEQRQDKTIEEGDKELEWTALSNWTGLLFCRTSYSNRRPVDWTGCQAELSFTHTYSLNTLWVQVAGIQHGVCGEWVLGVSRCAQWQCPLCF